MWHSEARFESKAVTWFWLDHESGSLGARWLGGVVWMRWCG